MKNGSSTYIRYIRVFSSQVGIYEMLDKDYRCPKDVLKMIYHGDVSRLVKEPYSGQHQYSWHECYVLGDEFLTFFNSKDRVIFLFKNGTWFVSFSDNPKPMLLSNYIRQLNV